MSQVRSQIVCCTAASTHCSSLWANHTLTHIRRRQRGPNRSSLVFRAQACNPRNRLAPYQDFYKKGHARNAHGLEMTALSPSRPPFPNLATKSTSTAQSSQLNALADNKGASGRPSSRTVPVTTTSSEAATSERATSNLIRKTLVSEGQHATSDLRSTSPTLIDAILPPLTSSNDIDVQLYAIVAIIIKDFVNSWYTRITPDRVFVDEVVQIIAHCSRAVEQRIRGIDMSELILDELPSVVERHVIAYRTASATSAALQYGDSPRRVYHALNPHPALDPSLPEDDRLNHESAYRQLLVQGALALLLPTEDLTNACLRALVTDIIADLILGRAVADRLCQPWFIHGIVSKLVEVVTSSAIGETHADQSSSQKHDRMSRLEKFGLLPSNNAVQPLDSPVKHQSPFSAWAWRLLQYVFVAYQTIRFFLLGMAHARHLPRRSYYHQQHQHPQRVKSLSTLSSSSSSRSTEPPTSSMQRHHDASHLLPRAVLDYRLFSCISTILDLSLRMPWLLAGFSFWQHLLCAGPGKHGAVDSTLDK
ncbi:hypothetical protein PV10_09036 [Exophiala mesophila]|uniref:PXA domain-containing protein n=1 Tax=Exophiala mesophila TaxID=212818 RepID=A0A0D1WH33_EXOME|nr:uncharacterized protein PV10_09036 [Exophiala mesophila]KIV88110.1 hypothetical protein PV10_09036 [Exophiala mesophila]